MTKKTAHHTAPKETLIDLHKKCLELVAKAWELRFEKVTELCDLLRQKQAASDVKVRQVIVDLLDDVHAIDEHRQLDWDKYKEFFEQVCRIQEVVTRVRFDHAYAGRLAHTLYLLVQDKCR